MVVDILEIYFVEHVKRTAEMKAVDDFLVELCEYAITNGDVIKCQADLCQGVLERIIGYTNNKRL